MIFAEFLAAVIERVPFTGEQTAGRESHVWSHESKIAFVEPTFSADSALVQMHDSTETDWRVAMVPMNATGIEIAAAGIRAFFRCVSKTSLSQNTGWSEINKSVPATIT